MWKGYPTLPPAGVVSEMQVVLGWGLIGFEVVRWGRDHMVHEKELWEHRLYGTYVAVKVGSLFQPWGRYP